MDAGEYLDALIEMLGDPSSVIVSPEAWRLLEQELGFELPSDYKSIIDRYAPVRLNEHIYLHHPATGRWNLREWVRETVQAWSQVEWEGVDIEGDPRPILGVNEIKFGVRQGLTPILSSDRGETVFLGHTAASSGARIFVETGDEEFFEYPVSFAEWLYRYLTGEDMAGPGSAIFYHGPVKFARLPTEAADPEVVWYGPDRGM
ncbi:SMI1/KNR4 family protein [Streptomyces sp. NPDC023998]|uniref:SMI1/KNR4 family protein n=1 Tax=Streptomyces sp. NPDC023998 TaxID=3154597 RepID=UPI00340467D1